MKKIGVLTFHYADNCGAQLQLRAMYRYLEKHGHLPEIIDYQSQILNKRNSLFQDPFFRAKMGWNSETGFSRKVYKALGGVLYAVRRNIKYPKLRKEAEAFKRYYKANPLNKSERIRNVDELANASKHYDCIIVGSDQVWNTELYNGIIDEVYFLRSSEIHSRKIGYALSAGNLLKMDKETIKDVVSNFDRVSAREQQLAEQITKVAGFEVPTVLDPVFLLSKTDWIDQCRELEYKKYIFLYVLETNKELLSILTRVKEHLGDDVTVIEVGFTKIYQDSILINQLDPQVFLSLIKNAECVISNSFHATAFSIIFEKSFYTLRHSTRNNRMESLLSKAGILERCISKSEDVVFSGIDYRKVDERLEKEIEHSKRYLADSIEGDNRDGAI